MNEEVDFVKRMAVVTKLATDNPGIGRTALMKCMYLLQTVKGVPLGYRFQLYAYGPYDSTVLDDLGMAEVWNTVEERVEQYSRGYKYAIFPGTKYGEFLESTAIFLEKHAEAIKWVIDNFKEYTAAGFELLGTMVWADREAQRSQEKWSKDELIRLVLEIKPRFSKDQADQIFEKLKRLGVFVAIA